MSRLASPARGALAPARSPARRAARRVALLARSFAAALLLAVSSLVGVVAAVFALLPPALNGGPEGRRIATLRRARPAAEEAEGPSPAEQALPQ